MTDFLHIIMKKIPDDQMEIMVEHHEIEIMDDLIEMVEIMEMVEMT